MHPGTTQYRPASKKKCFFPCSYKVDRKQIARCKKKFCKARAELLKVSSNSDKKVFPKYENDISSMR